MSPQPVPGAAWAARRRAAVSARFAGERVVVPSGGLKVRSNDFDYAFRPHSAYIHLTAEQGTGAVPDSVLVFEPSGSGHEVTLFVRPRSPRDPGAGSTELHRDSRHGEFWVGRRRTLTETADALGIGTDHRNRLESALATGVPTRVVRGQDPLVDSLVPPSDTADAELSAFLSEL
ncbi:aminopeptidase P family protein, partial [Streptomyces sp. SID8455]|nr:aminopeptidase P family protein [Streptomyces sp. SID8455]